MGSTLGSILQTVGQTGNEVGAANEANINQSHQFMMDYLANQARSRGLDIAQTGQQNTLNIAQQDVNLRKQQLEQSRWQVMPGYTRIPHPDDPTKTLFRTTLLDPVNNQRRFYDTDQPPVGSPEYIMQGYNYADKISKSAGIPLSPIQKLAFGGMKADTIADKNQQYSSLYDMMAGDPEGLRYLKANYPGGRGQFIDQHVKAGEAGYAKEDQIAMIRDFVNSGKTTTGNIPVNQGDKALLTSYNQSLTAYTKQLSDAEKVVSGMSYSRFLNPDTYSAAVQTRDTAKARLDEVKDKITALTATMTAGQAAPSTPSTPSTPAPAYQNPPVPHPEADKAQSKALALGLTHKWTDKNGNIIGFSKEDKSGYHSVATLNK